MGEKALVSGSGSGADSRPKSRRRYRRADTTPVYLNQEEEVAATDEIMTKTETSFQHESQTITTTTNHEFSSIMTSATTTGATTELLQKQHHNTQHDPTLDTDIERKQITEPIRTRVKAPGGRRLPSRFKK